MDYFCVILNSKFKILMHFPTFSSSSLMSMHFVCVGGRHTNARRSEDKQI